MNSTGNAEVATTLTMLAKEVCAILDREHIDVDAKIADLGIDSLTAVEMMLVCDQIYPSGINPEKLTIDLQTTMRELDRQLSSLEAR